jgi:hypothetical protein
MLATLLCSTTPAEGLQVVSERPGGPSVDYDGGLAAGEDYRTLQV